MPTLLTPHAVTVPVQVGTIARISPTYWSRARGTSRGTVSERTLPSWHPARWRDALACRLRARRAGRPMTVIIASLAIVMAPLPV